MVLATYAAATSRIGLGTAVMPIYTRHPTAMAQMALTLDEISGGRFRLGIGVSHQVTVESMWGLRLVHPVEAMREYAGIVRALTTTGAVSEAGEQFTAHTAYTAPRRPDLPILISALSPRMLELAGEIADGVSLWMCAPDYIRDVVVPAVRKGREKAGKTLDGFELEAAVPVCLTTDRAAGLVVFRKTAERYASLPFYRKVLDKTFPDMSDSPDDRILGTLAGIGDSAELRATIGRYRDAGTTLPVVGPFGGHEGAAGFEATLEALAA
jgi:alkanesulfonate monooxygenase SsuD/methylene tetrahydromethanopterin reductase-like flavin-dependent oxidoreductase (luciferase family)